jgi:hypothetical protein
MGEAEGLYVWRLGQILCRLLVWGIYVWGEYHVFLVVYVFEPMGYQSVYTIRSTTKRAVGFPGFTTPSLLESTKQVCSHGSLA